MPELRPLRAVAPGSERVGICPPLALDGKHFRFDAVLEALLMDYDRHFSRIRRNATLLITPVIGLACQHVGAAMVQLGAQLQQDSGASPGLRRNVSFTCSIWPKRGQSSNGQLSRRHGLSPWPWKSKGSWTLGTDPAALLRTTTDLANGMMQAIIMDKPWQQRNLWLGQPASH